MANVTSFFGFKRVGVTSGPPNFAFTSGTSYRISSGYTSAIYFGDLVRMNTSATTGYLQIWVNGDGSTATNIPVGIFLGCTYYSTSQQKMISNRYYPGSDATGDVTAHVCDDPGALWVVQMNTGTATYANIGQTADIATSPAGNTTTGISGMSLAAPGAGTTQLAPFKIAGLITTPPGANGADITTANNYVIVAFNNQMFKALSGV